MAVIATSVFATYFRRLFPYIRCVGLSIWNGRR